MTINRFDVYIVNNTNTPMIAKYDRSIGHNYISVNDKTRLAIERLDVPTDLIPLSIIRVNHNDETELVIRFNDKEGVVKYSGSNMTLNNSTGLRDKLSNDYPFIREINSYTLFLNSINKTLEDLALEIGYSVYPKISYDYDDMKFRIDIPEVFYNEEINIQFNEDMKEWFNHFEFAKNNDGFYNLVYLQTKDEGFIKQYFSNIETWHTIRRLVISSKSLPIKYENVYGYDESNESKIKILTDLNTFTDSSHAHLHYIEYTPKILRYVEFTQGIIQLTHIDVSLHYIDRYGRMNDLFIGKDKTASMKIKITDEFN